MRLHEEDGTIMVDFAQGLVGWFDRSDLELTWRPPALRLAGPTPPPLPPEDWIPAREPKTRLTAHRVADIDPDVRKPPRMCRDFVRARECRRPGCPYEHAFTEANELIEPLQWEDGHVTPGRFKVVFHVISEPHGMPRYRGPKVTRPRAEARVTFQVGGRDDGPAAARSDGAAAGAVAASETEGTVEPAYHFFLGAGPMSFHDA